jgi:hypothetical protein
MLWKLEGSSNENIWKMTKSEVPSIVVAEWLIWVPTMFVTFRYVPVKFQVLVINVVGVGWQTFLAYMASNAHTKEMVEDVVDDVIEAAHDVPVIQKVPIFAATSFTNSNDRDDADDNTNHGTITSNDIIEGKIVPLVLNTIVRHNTPKYVELEHAAEQTLGDDYH